MGFLNLLLRSFAIAAGLVPIAAQSQSLEIAPISVDLPLGRLTTTLRITNPSDQPTTVQLRPFTWSQPGGEEQLGPTSDLLVSPPFATIAAGDTQTVRVVLRKPATTREDSYRLILDQLPPAAVPGTVRVALRISLPVFAAPQTKARPSLEWRYDNADPTHASLIVRNSGTRRARLSDLAVGPPGHVARVPGFTFRYVLAGSEISIPVGADQSAPKAGTVHVTASSDLGPVEADAPVSPAH